MGEGKKCGECRYCWQEIASPFYYCGKHPPRYIERRYRICLTNKVEIKTETIPHYIRLDTSACDMFESRY